MKNIFDHIEYVKGKPHHIRKRIAMGTAAAGSALIALVWLVGSYATGAFAIQGGSFAVRAEQTTVATTSSSSDQGLAGAAAALGDTSAPAHIEIVDTTVAPSVKKQSEQTTLPF